MTTQPPKHPAIPTPQTLANLSRQSNRQHPLKATTPKPGTFAQRSKQERQEAGRLGGRHRVASGAGHTLTAADRAKGGKNRHKQSPQPKPSN